ncbi:hypothetical protein HBI07_219220 [Parastagonospora nodorum]|nr:hypothetical protein HBI07_219220 [Parastagonospora nodorum]
MLQTYYIIKCTNNAGNTAKLRTMQSATLLSLSRETILQSNSQDLTRELVQPEHESTLNKAQVILLSQLLTNDGTTLCSTPSEAQKTAPLLVRSSIATTLCRNICSDLQTHIMRQARIEVTAAYALNYLELRVLKLTLAYGDKFQFLSANMIALIGTVLYNAIKEYHDDRTRKTIYFYSHTVEDNYNAIRKKRLSRQRQDYNRAEKREDNILTIDECRTGHSNKEDIEADEREEETRVRLRESSEEIHDILLREFRGANDFTESIIHNDDEQELELEDCDALVERYEEEINCSDLYSTV